VGNDEKAEKNYLKSIELNSRIPQTYINLVDIYYRQQRYAEGINILSYAIDNLPDDLIFRHYLARFYMEDCRLDLAVDELEKVLEHQPENYDAYYDLGKVHYELGNYDCAIENFENILEFKEDNPYIYFYLAQAYEMNNEIDKAISNYLKTIAQDSGFRQAYKKVAILFLARGDFDDSIEYLEEYSQMELPEEEIKNIKELIERIKKKKLNG
jgi:tetratricopeptide (TPR) repeat protein